MDVSVTKLDDDSYEVKIGEKRITLPKGSSFKEETTEEGQTGTIGTETAHLAIDPYENSILYVTGDGEEVILSGDDEDEKAHTERGSIISDLYTKWKAAKGGSRLNRKARRTKRNRRNLKRSKLRKLTTRRR